MAATDPKGRSDHPKVALCGYGAYGFRVHGLDGLERLLTRAEPDWPPYSVSVDVGETSIVEELVTDATARLRLRTGGCVAIEREPGLIAYTRSEEHTSELQSQFHLVCRLLLEKKK